MKKITRTIETHVITPAKVGVEKGQVISIPLDKITVENQTMNDEKALKIVQKEYGKSNQYVILNIETTSKTYGIDFDVFMKNATEII